MSVYHTSEPCKNGCTDRAAFWVEDSGGPRNHVLDGVQIPLWEGKEGKKGRPIVSSVVICAETDEPIEMPFGLWARMGRRNHVLDGGPAMLRDVTMATNFVTKIANNWLRVNDSD